jgi:hypothetical protein
MSLSRESIDQAKKGYEQTNQNSAIASMPPGYISGFIMTLNPDNSVTIGAGIASVAGRRVAKGQQNIKQNWDNFTRNIVALWAYLYLDTQGNYHVDSLHPVYNGTYFSYYHPVQNYLFVGRLWIDTTGICRFAQSGGYAVGA